jgi:hypothetical protein
MALIVRGVLESQAALTEPYLSRLRSWPLSVVLMADSHIVTARQFAALGVVDSILSSGPQAAFTVGGASWHGVFWSSRRWRSAPL